DRSIRLWDVPSGTTRANWLGPWPPGPVADRPMLHLDLVEAIAVAPDGKTVATAARSPIVTLWDVSTHEVRRRFRGPGGVVRALAFSPDGSNLVTGGDSKVVRVWELATGRERATLAGHVGAITSLAFAADGKALASGS